MAQFVDSLYVVILDLSDKVHMIKESWTSLCILFSKTTLHSNSLNDEIMLGLDDELSALGLQVFRPIKM